MKELVADLVAYLKTKDNLTDFLSRLDTALLDLSLSDLSQLNLYFTHQEIALLATTISDVNQLKELRARLSRIAVFTVKLAFKPSAFFESQVNNFIIKAVKDLCVIQIVFDRSILGGAIIDFQGKYRDYSLRAAIEEWRRKRAL